MALEKVTKDYEILIRYNEDGRIGVQKQQITYYIDDGVVSSSRLESPVEVDITELKSIVKAFNKDMWFVYNSQGDGEDAVTQ